MVLLVIHRRIQFILLFSKSRPVLLQASWRNEPLNSPYMYTPVHLQQISLASHFVPFLCLCCVTHGAINFAWPAHNNSTFL